MAAVGDLDHPRPRPPARYLRRGPCRQEVGALAAQQEHRAADRVPHKAGFSEPRKTWTVSMGSSAHSLPGVPVAGAPRDSEKVARASRPRPSLGGNGRCSPLPGPASGGGSPHAAHPCDRLGGGRQGRSLDQDHIAPGHGRRPDATRLPRSISHGEGRSSSPASSRASCRECRPRRARWLRPAKGIQSVRNAVRSFTITAEASSVCSLRRLDLAQRCWPGTRPGARSRPRWPRPATNSGRRTSPDRTPPRATPELLEVGRAERGLRVVSERRPPPRECPPATASSTHDRTRSASRGWIKGPTSVSGEGGRRPAAHEPAPRTDPGTPLRDRHGRRCAGSTRKPARHGSSRP